MPELSQNVVIDRANTRRQSSDRKNCWVIGLFSNKLLGTLNDSCLLADARLPKGGLRVPGLLTGVSASRLVLLCRRFTQGRPMRARLMICYPTFVVSILSSRA
jgi:hypothetical protein